MSRDDKDFFIIPVILYFTVVIYKLKNVTTVQSGL